MLYMGDFNGDKHKDVIAVGPAADGTSGPHLFLGRGDGNFEDPVVVSNFSDPFTFIYQRTSVFDVNRDDRDDLVNVTTDQSSGMTTVNVLLSKGDGTLEPVTTTVPTTNTYDAAPASADFNADGKPDLIVPAQQTVEVLMGSGDGTFDPEPQGLSVPSLENRGVNYIPAVVAGDFDHDGSADFAILASYSPTAADGNDGPTVVYVYYGNGDGNFSPSVTAAVLDRVYLNFIASDLNGDGLTDFVLSTNQSNGIYFDYAGSAISFVHGFPDANSARKQTSLPAKDSPPWR